MLNEDYTRNLHQQVMSPAALNGNAIQTTLPVATNFVTWKKRMINFISTVNLE